MNRISVRLSVFLAVIVVVLLAGAGLAVTAREVQVVRDLVLRDAQTVALSGAQAYAAILESGIDSGELTLEDVLEPKYDEMKFHDLQGNPIRVEDPRFRTKVGDYTDGHGVGLLQDATMAAGGFLFASGMDQRGYVPTPHHAYANPPRGMANDENRDWDRKYSRGKRRYTDSEQIAAAGYLGNAAKPTLIQEYTRDTGDPAWDVAAPITVKGKHWGAFRVGVPRDRIAQQYHELVVGLSVLFGLLVIVAVAAIFWMSWRLIRPLTVLTAEVDRVSRTSDTSELGAKIECGGTGEIRDAQAAFNRMLVSLHGAMTRLEAIPRASTASDATGSIRVLR